MPEPATVPGLAWTEAFERQHEEIRLSDALGVDEFTEWCGIAPLIGQSVPSRQRQTSVGAQAITASRTAAKEAANLWLCRNI